MELSLLDEELRNKILNELSCPICLDVLQLPVTLSCGHSFCRYCISSNISHSVFNCPLCRQPLLQHTSINNVLHNIIRLLNIQKPPDEGVSHANLQFVEIIWKEKFTRDLISVPLFLRVVFEPLKLSSVLMQDFQSCVLHHFNKEFLWSQHRWIFGKEDFLCLAKLINIDMSCHASAKTRIESWVLNYVTQYPSCMPSDSRIPFGFQVNADKLHKVSESFYDLSHGDLKFPVDAGRHSNSSIYLTHASVSLSHFLLVDHPQGCCGVIDCGSTIGTMIQISPNGRPLRHGDVIHLHDRSELIVTIVQQPMNNPYQFDTWSETYGWTGGNRKPCDALGKSYDTESHEVTDGLGTPRLSDSESEMPNPMGEPNVDETVHSVNEFLKLSPREMSEQFSDTWAYPGGTIVGRGPAKQRENAIKLSITNENGYISREHCLIEYKPKNPPGEKWFIYDLSSLGTYIRLSPFSEPEPLQLTSVLKVGQCKLNIVSK